MRRCRFAVLLSVVLSAGTLVGDEPKPAADEAAEKSEVMMLPKGLVQFNGMLVGRLVSKDVETGSFVVQVDAVSRVWRNGKAKNPKSIVGDTVEVGGVSGRFLDVLVVTRPGETIEFECTQNGDKLRFPGELLRRVAPYDPGDYPELPEVFRGFQGAVRAKVVKKDPETFEMIVKVQTVLETWKDSQAQTPKSIEGKPLLLAGFWNRKEQYHNIKPGDLIEVGLNHIALRSDHVNMAEFVRAAKEDTAQPKEMKPAASKVKDGLTEERRGFRGMLVGRLVKKDVELGTFSILVDAVPRVWRNSEALDPKSFIGQQAHAANVPSRLLDGLLVAKIGDTIEFGALHDGGDSLRVGELLRKVAPVEPGSYPALPDAFRGFHGRLVGTVVRKDDELLELIIRVNKVIESSDNSKAEDAGSIVGKDVMLSGFWRRKDEYHDLNVDDTIRFSVDHSERLSDSLNVGESLKRTDSN